MMIVISVKLYIKFITDKKVIFIYSLLFMFEDVYSCAHF